MTLSRELIDRCHARGIKVFSDALGPHERIEDYQRAIRDGIDLIQHGPSGSAASGDGAARKAQIASEIIGNASVADVTESSASFVTSRGATRRSRPRETGRRWLRLENENHRRVRSRRLQPRGRRAGNSADSRLNRTG